MTFGELEAEVRTQIKDSSPSYRWTSPVVLGALVSGVKYLRSIRPESRYSGLVLSNPEYPITDPSAPGYNLETAQAFEVGVDERWHTGIVYYGAARCLEIDGADTINATMSTDFFTKAIGIFQS